MSNKPRGLRLTPKGYRAIGVSPTVFVPLLDLPWHEEKNELNESMQDIAARMEGQFPFKSRFGATGLRDRRMRSYGLRPERIDRGSSDLP